MILVRRRSGAEADGSDSQINVCSGARVSVLAKGSSGCSHWKRDPVGGIGHQP